MSTPVLDDTAYFLEHCRRGYLQGVTEYLTNFPAVLDNKDKAGWTGLHYATHANHLDVVQSLVAAKADLDLTNGAGETALFMAANKGYVPIVLALVRGGASTTLPSADGTLPVQIAANEEVKTALTGTDPAGPTGAGFSYLQDQEEPDSE